MAKASCLCGGIRYEVTGELGPVALCHCGMCRKASGSAFAANASVARDGFRLTHGAELVQRYESSPGNWRCFCRVCGTPVFSEKRDAPETVRVRLGLFDDRAQNGTHDPRSNNRNNYALHGKQSVEDGDSE